MSQVSMSGTMSLYLNDSEYLKIQSELDQEKKRQLQKNDDKAAEKNSASSQAILEKELKDREAELDRLNTLKIQETDKKEQKEEDARKAEETARKVEETSAKREEANVSADNGTRQAVSRSSENEESRGQEEESRSASTEETQREDKNKDRMDRFEELQTYMKSLQGMNTLGQEFIRKISQTDSEIRTDGNNYNYADYSRSITSKEQARDDLERRKQSVEDRAGKTLRDTFETLNKNKLDENRRQQNERMDKMQQNLSGLRAANTAFSRNVDFTF